MKRRISIFFIIFTLLLTLFATPSPAKADGMILPPDPYYYPVYETQQKALIIYEEGHEDLIVSISFSGEVADFGWVIPLPNQPEVSKVDSELFSNLADVTKPKQNLLEKIRGESYGGYITYNMELAAPKGDLYEETTVEVLEEDSIGIYDYAVLKAEDVNDLKDWMDDHEYLLPSGGDDYTDDLEDIEMFLGQRATSSQDDLWSDALPIFQDYIDNEWYFVTVRINNTFQDSSGVEGQLESGAVDPLRFSFDTTDMIFPMKLTSLAKRDVGVTLYILSEDKMMVKNYDESYCSSDDKESCSLFETAYASKINEDEIKEFTKDLGKGYWYEPTANMYITKLNVNYLSYTQMTKEVEFKKSKNNNGVHDGSMTLWEWVQLPFVILVYLPYYILGGFVEVLDFGYYGGYGYDFYGLGMIWFFIASAVLFFGSIAWIVITLLLLRKARNKLKRAILYMLQFPSVWLVAFGLSFAAALPVGMLVALLAQNEEIAFIDGFCCFSYLTSLIPVLFYKIVWKRRRIKKNRKL